MTLIKGRPVGIAGTGIYIPEKIMTNHDLEKIVDTNDQWIVERTGIRERHIMGDDESNAGMTAAAARDAIADAGLTADDIDMIVVGTNSPDMLFPGVGPIVQGLIGAHNAGGMDIQAGCPGALFGLAAAAGGVASGIWNNVIVSGSEAFTRILDWTDRNTCIIFGDGVGACVLSEWRPGMLRLSHIDVRADGSKGDLITFPGGLAAEPASHKTVDERRHHTKMQGNEVFKFITRMMPEYLTDFCRGCGLETNDIDWWIIHQANIRIVEAIMRRLDIPMDRAIMNIHKYGNVPSATIMLALHEGRVEGMIKPGQKIIMASFGAGMTYGAALLES